MAEIKKISTEFQLLDKFLDTSGDAGTSGQVLSSTATGINWVSGSSLPGGPYLPLSAGSGEILTGDLAMNNNIGIITKDSSGAFRDILKLKSTNVLEIGSSSLATDTIFKNSGNVGIGTTSPQTKLAIGSAQGSGIDFLYDATNNYKHQIKNYWNSSTDSRMDFNIGRTSGQTPETIMSVGYGGNVGIGTTSPGYTLEIAGPTATSFAYQRTGVSANKWGFHSDNDATYWQNLTSSNLLFTLQNGGNVGIGTTSPIGKFNVSKDSTTDGLSQAITVSSSSVSTKRMNLGYVPGSNYAFIDVINYAISNTNQALSLQPNGGNVGIGTTSPLNKLHVEGNVNGAVQIEVDNQSTGNASYAGLFLHGQGNNFFLKNWGDQVPSFTNITEFVSTAGSSSFVFSPGTSEKMRITSSGNVGIGTTSPDGKLDVAQNMTAGTTTAFTSPHLSLTALNATDNTGFVGMTFATSDNTNYGWSWGALRTNGGLGDMVLRNHYNSAQGTERMRMLANGNVGIGTTSPSEKLEVSGKAFINGQIYGGFGALTTNGTLDWNDSTNARSGNGHTLLRGNATNGPAGSEYYHPFSWEYSSYDNDGNMTQFAIPYASNNTGMYYRNRYNGTWNDWAEIVTTTKTLPGGPYLPLSAGSSYPLTGDLYLKTASNQGNLFFGTADANYKIFGGGYYGYMGYNTGGYHRFLTSGVEKMRITSAGNVGIGTTSPATVLDVRSGGANTLPATTGTTPSTGTRFRLANTGGASAVLDFGISTGGKSWLQSTDRTDLSVEYPFLINPNGGNVGIGTTSPIAKFSVVGSDNTNQTSIGHSTQAVFIKVNGTNVDYNSSGNSSGSHTFSTGNVERMRITLAGNVGIGTTSPAAKLEVDSITYSASNAIANFVNGNNPVRVAYDTVVIAQTDVPALSIVETIDGSQANEQKLTFSVGDNKAVIASTSTATDGMYFNVNRAVDAPAYSTGNGITALKISNNGNVGIGTTSPIVKLHTRVSSSTTALMLENSTGGGGAYVDLDFNTYNTAQAGFSNAAASIRVIDNGAFGGDITFRGKTAGVGNAQNELMRIKATGNVGIGTTSPVSKLEVSSGPGANGDCILTVSADTDNSTATSNPKLLMLQKGSTKTSLIEMDSSNRTHFSNSDGYYFSGGNVGIGTTSPSYKLEVSGTLGVNRTDGIIFAGSAAAGYGNKITADTSNDFIFSTSLPSAPYTVSEKMRIANGGATTFTSTVTATNFILSSDERLKENVEKVCDNRVKADWKTFELKTDKGQKRYGVIAQELEKTNPEFVREDSQGFKSVAYIDLLIAKIAELEARLEKLEK